MQQEDASSSHKKPRVRKKQGKKGEKDALKQIKVKHFKKAILEKVYVIDDRFNKPLTGEALCEKFVHFATSHNLRDAINFLPVLASNKRVAQDLLLRGVIVVASSYVHTGSLVIDHHLKNLFQTFFKSLCLKSEVLIELMTFYFSNGEFEAAQQDLLLRSGRYLDHGYTHETFVVIELLASAYLAILDFVMWWKQVHNLEGTSSTSDEALEMFTSQITLRIKTIVISRKGPFDFLIPRLLDLLLYKDQVDDAKECLVAYKNKNPDNLNACIYLLKFLERFPSRSQLDEELYLECAKKLSKHSPGDALIFDIIESNIFEKSKQFELLMEFLDYYDNKDNLNAWKKLYNLLEELEKEVINTTAIDLYNTKYASYWIAYHLDDSQLVDMPSREQIDLIRYKAKVIFFFDKENRFLQSANKWLDQFQME